MVRRCPRRSETSSADGRTWPSTFIKLISAVFRMKRGLYRCPLRVRGRRARYRVVAVAATERPEVCTRQSVACTTRCPRTRRAQRAVCRRRRRAARTASGGAGHSWRAVTGAQRGISAMTMSHTNDNVSEMTTRIAQAVPDSSLLKAVKASTET